MFKFLVSSSYRTECFIRFKEKSLKFIAGKNKHQEIEINNNDYLCIPEVRGPNIGDIEKGLKKVILNQNPFYTFNKYSRNKEEMRTPYFEDDLAATIVFSENNLNYMKYVFPQLKLFRIHYGFDSELFNYCTQKKKQIAYMPRKLDKHVTQIINILKFKGALKDFKLVEIDNAKESKVAEVLRESLMFLSFSCDEGFGMPSAEAMACGCIVVGYDGEGGKEFFKKEFCYPIRYGDLVGFARTIEKIIKEYEDNQTYFLEKGRKASEFILKNYSLQKEEADIVRVWEEILGYHPKSLSNI